MHLQLPTEVWLHIAKFIPKDEIRNFLGVNRLFFDLAMNDGYQVLKIDVIKPEARRIISQLSDPTIAKRVQCLGLQLNHIVQLSDSRPRSGIDRLMTRLSHPNSRPPVSVLVEDLAALFSSMVNVEEFSVDAWNVPLELDLRSFFSAAWLGFGQKVRKLSLGGNIGGFKVMVASQPVLTAIEELHLEFADSLNSSVSYPTGTGPVGADTQGLHNIIAPFINNRGAQLHVLKVWSWASIDLSTFFKLLGPFPLLHTLNVRAAFDGSFVNDPSGLTQLLHGTSSTLKDLMLRLNPAEMFSFETDASLSHWLSETIQNNDRVGIGLRCLHFYPFYIAAGLDSLVLLIERSAKTLEELYVRDRYLLPPEITRITAAFSPYTKLTSLRLNLRRLPAPLLDLFAESFTNLKSLGLRVADGEPAPDFVREIRTKRYNEWKLHDIGIWQGGRELDYEIMLILSECIPSVDSFWGRGHL